MERDEGETKERKEEERGPGGRGDWGAWGGSGGQNQPGQGDFEPEGHGAKQRERRRSEKTLNSGSSGSVAYPCGALPEAEGSKLGPSRLICQGIKAAFLPMGLVLLEFQRREPH